MGVVLFNSVSSQLYDIQVEHPPEYETPERDYIVTAVPGRNGDLVQDTGSYQNVPRAYEIAVGSLEKQYSEMAGLIANWLHTPSGYARLEDSYEPLYFRLAMYKESNILTNLMQHAGRVTIKFDCKPQRYLKSGEAKIILTGAGSVVNPTPYNALPIIRIKGSGAGVVNVGGYTITISSIVNYIDIDSGIQDSYNVSTNLNNYVTLSKSYPKLVPGSNVISFSGGVTSVEVTPRWWTI